MIKRSRKSLQSLGTVQRPETWDKIIHMLKSYNSSAEFVPPLLLSHDLIKNMGHGFVLFRAASENFGDRTSLLDTEVSGVINKCRKLHSLYLHSCVCNTL